MGEAGGERGAIPFGNGPVGVRWSDIVDDGEGRLSRKGPRVGGTFSVPEMVREGNPSPLLWGGIVFEAEVLQPELS
jgi:hypothetical protein